MFSAGGVGREVGANYSFARWKRSVTLNPRNPWIFFCLKYLFCIFNFVERILFCSMCACCHEALILATPKRLRIL